ncbi:XK-related protein 8-like [Eucyclogobius newberryi]|uniref:XK-related protein 8-like n=1 Tax=Eucyclogobius newberryi TaxID=166745 RepID=UPI003B5AE7B0
MSSVFHFSPWDFFFTVLGLVGLVLDIILDIVAVVDFYRDNDLVRLGLLILFLVGSSLLVQSYSWFWYKYDHFNLVSQVEKTPSLSWLKVLHVLQLGTYLRHMGVMEMAVRKYWAHKGRGSDPGDVAVVLSHDVAMLRIVEAFSESLPQLVLMVSTNIQRGHLDTVPVLKAVASASFVSFTVMSYHRSLRSFLKDKRKQTLASSGVYFLWNFVLIAARVTALALFASALPCYVAAHLLCSWTLLLVCAWSCQTNFMDSKGGEVLYRCTVALIWYFSWFNVVDGNTRRRVVLYHGYVLADMALLCGLWFWTVTSDLAHFNYQHLIVLVCVLFVYILGLFIKSVYHHCFHPNVTSKDLKEEQEEQEQEEQEQEEQVEEEQVEEETGRAADVVDHMFRSAGTPADVVYDIQRSPSVKKTNKRMRKLAESFYS